MPTLMQSLLQFFTNASLRLLRPLRRQWVMVLLLCGLLVSNACITGRPSHDPAYYALVALMDLFMLATMVEVLPKIFGKKGQSAVRGLLKFCIYVSAFALWSVELFLFERYHLCLSPTVFHLLLETNPNESQEFVDAMLSHDVFWQVAYITSALVLLTLLLEGALRIDFRGTIRCEITYSHDFLRKHRSWFKKARTFSRNVRTFREKGLRFWHAPQNVFHRICGVGRTLWQHPFPQWGAVLLLWGVFLTALVFWGNHQRKMVQFFGNLQSEHAEAVAESEFFTPYYRTFQAVHLVRMAVHETDALAARMAQLPPAEVADGHCPNIVVIIGESFSKHHSALYGYGLPTNPRLSERQRRGELVVFGDVVSPWNITSNAFRAFLSTHSADEPGRWTDGVLFPALFKCAGFRVAFVSNQFFHTASQGSIDFNGSFFLNDSTLEKQCFDHRNGFRSKHDGNILTLLKGYAEGARNLYLLHLWGQHMEYEKRYPRDSARFDAHDIRQSDLPEESRKIVAHYDNATRWNDEVVDRILKRFEKEDAVVVYFSDHGEEVFDPGVPTYGRIHDETPSQAVIRHEYEVPFMVWGSAKFRQRHPAVFARMQQVRDMPFSHDDLPHLLLGLSGIRTPYYQAERDPLSQKFRPHRRLLRGHLDYDAVMRKTSPQKR